MTTEEIKALIRREAEETWQSGNTPVIHETSHAHRVSIICQAVKKHRGLRQSKRLGIASARLFPITA